jgi:hypothetical protein
MNKIKAFLGCDIPNEVTVNPPTDIHSKGQEQED